MVSSGATSISLMKLIDALDELGIVLIGEASISDRGGRGVRLKK